MSKLVFSPENVPSAPFDPRDHINFHNFMLALSRNAAARFPSGLSTAFVAAALQYGWMTGVGRPEISPTRVSRLTGIPRQIVLDRLQELEEMGWLLRCAAARKVRKSKDEDGTYCVPTEEGLQEWWLFIDTVLGNVATEQDCGSDVRS